MPGLATANQDDAPRDDEERLEGSHDASVVLGIPIRNGTCEAPIGERVEVAVGILAVQRQVGRDV